MSLLTALQIAWTVSAATHVSLRLGMRSSDALEEWASWYFLIHSILAFMLAVGYRAEDSPALSALFLFLSMLDAAAWWYNDRNKRRRKKLLDRAAGRVRDLGGRLKVVRPSEG